MAKIKHRFYFPDMNNIIKKYVKACKDCQSRKHDYGLPKGGLTPIESTEPFQIIGMDFLDRGTQFCSDLAERIYEIMHTKHIKTSPYHPQCNGLAEKQLFAYNTAKQESTRNSPFYLLYGRHPRLPIDNVLNLSSSFDDTKEVQIRFQEARVMVKEFIKDAQARQKRNYDKNHRFIEFNIGAKVLLYRKRRVRGLSEKLINNFYEVIEKFNNAYTIKDIYSAV
ncbi:uncharacterized protein LOC128959605 [Oppia nitens]|uniref:uncharacterized protein LOC128959605 n=1 Tax=Oppia nitens TaxID=1686743 RepID=UPI0023DBAF54|nr:uncharacterized protein LOC128959605 [Oppia nitens]